MKTAREVDAEAARWFVENDRRGGGSSEPAFEHWLHADPRHRAAYLRLAAAWRKADVLGRMRPPDGAVDMDLLLPEEVRRAGRRRVMFGFAAVIAACAATVAIAALFARDDWTTVTTPLGGRDELALADGSTIHVNSDSELSVRLTPRRRTVVLVRGDAHFRVAHDLDRPFEVEANGVTVRAVGTAYSVRKHSARRIDVLVREGAVAIAIEGQPGVTHRIAAGEAATVRDRQVHVRKLGADAVDRSLAWMDGKIIFLGETVGEAVAEFNRYNSRQIEIVDRPVAAHRLLGGNFDTTAIDDFVLSIEDLGVRAEHVPPSAGSPGAIRLFATSAQDGKQE
jgi:transmembrane sensor